MSTVQADVTQLIEAYQNTRKMTDHLCFPLEVEDYVIQGTEDVSPAKWHLAHTTWFFETLVLIPHMKSYRPFDPLFHRLFNSYYQGLGSIYPRTNRGLLSRPTVKTIQQYRQVVDQKMVDFISTCASSVLNEIGPIITLGLHHEQQHQELLLTDIKFNYSLNLDFPVYQPAPLKQHNGLMKSPNINFIPIDATIADIGHGFDSFAYDNEKPVHACILNSYEIANRLVTNAEYLEFIEAGGYRNPMYWLSDGLDTVMKHHWQAPLYWYLFDNEWHIYGLNGLTKVNLDEPVCHVSFYEADAYARFRGARLPTEQEWEYAVHYLDERIDRGHFLEQGYFHPIAGDHQFLGNVWEWTMSPYTPYPGYMPFDGVLEEYNAKFMCNQMVLRGGSCVTPRSHIRATYRNFFYADKRWQFCGIRLAKTR